MKRIFIWNAHWHSVGGGEIYALTLAKSLLESGNYVELGSLGAFPHKKLKEVFGLTFPINQIIEIDSENELPSFLSGFDLFINASFGSHFSVTGINSIYICHFPSKLPIRKKLANTINSLGKGKIFAYSNSRLLYAVNEETQYTFEGIQLFADKKVTYSMAIDGFKLTGAKNDDKPARTTKVFELPEHQPKFINKKMAPRQSIIISGLPKLSLRTFIINSIFSRRTYLDEYFDIWVHSNFVNGYVKKYWYRDAFTISPPVKISNKPGLKTRNPYGIVSVGRFFDPRNGHSKNQLLLVRAFSSLAKISDKPWKLHLVGTSTDTEKPYLEKIRSEIGNLDVEIHENASLETLLDLYQTNSFYWHAAGVGQKKTHPINFEHFGITIVEAMNNGLIPLVYEMGGPAEVLEAFQDLIYSDIVNLPSKTVHLLKSDIENLRSRLYSESLSYSAKNFAIHALERIRLLGDEVAD